MLICYNCQYFFNVATEGWKSENGDFGAGVDDGASERKRKRKSRWNTDNDDKTVIPGMPTVIPPNLTESQQRQYVGRFFCS